MSMPSNISHGAAGPGQDGDVSMLSVATDASTTATSKPRVNGKTAKEENDSVGIDVCVITSLYLRWRRWARYQSIPGRANE